VLLVHDYTKRKLTFGEDGINAISSLFSLMSYSFTGGFIAGLPEMFFNEALLWQPAEPIQRRWSPKDVNNLPSWSWVGWEGELMMDTWLGCWSHLYLDRKSPRQVIPAVSWYFGSTLKERIPVNISGHTYIEYTAE